MSEARIVYTPRPDATSESEAAALASVYSYILDCASKRVAAHAPSNGPNNTKVRSSDDSDGDEATIPR